MENDQLWAYYIGPGERCWWFGQRKEVEMVISDWFWIDFADEITGFPEGLLWAVKKGEM